MSNSRKIDHNKIFLDLASTAREETPFFSDIWTRSRNEFNEKWVQEITQAIVQLMGYNKIKWRMTLRGYGKFAFESARCQKEFETSERYNLAETDEKRLLCYNDKSYMMKNYLPGLYLSNYLWPHHFKLLTFYRNQILKDLKCPKMFYDIGVGTGLYSKELLSHFPHSIGKGFDISPYSLEFTRNLLNVYCVKHRYKLIHNNINTMKLSNLKADFVICHELLEHLKDPKKMCGILHKITRVGGRSFITAAMNSAHPDHIYLFRDEDEVRTMLVDEGWNILKTCVEYAYESKPKRITPSVVGFYCERKEKQP